MSKPWYIELYEHFPDYDEEPYTANTPQEVDFIESVLGTDRGVRILDVGCGTGRHALELARRGYQVVGVDLSSALLAKARQTAQAEGLDVEFIQRDARELGFEAAFDVVMSLCEGGFSLMESDDMDRLILSNMRRAIRATSGMEDAAQGTLILTAPNAAFMLAQGGEEGYDPVSSREEFELDATGVDGRSKTLHCSQRYYARDELHAMLCELGFKKVKIFSITGSGYDLTREPSEQDYELGVVARI